jgi:hypothetical protein
MTCSEIGIAKDDVRGSTEKTEKQLDQLKSLTVEDEMLSVDQSADLSSGGILTRNCCVFPQLMTFPVRAKPPLCGRASIPGTVVKLL